MSARRRLAVAVPALVAALAAGRAQAFVSSMTTGTMPAAFYWKESCVPVTIYLNGFLNGSGMSRDQIVKSVAAAAHTWSGDAVTCPNGDSPYLEIVPSVAPESAAPPAIAWDARNSIIFRTELWSKGAKPGQKYEYDVEALAVTSVTARSDGHIVDVDMEVNGVSQSWMNLDPGVTIPSDHGETRRVFDLQNALTHEFGHLIGLDHTCFIPSLTNPAVGKDGKFRSVDNTGKPAPDCDDSPAEIMNTVMFNRTSPGETSKRVLSPDDILAVCTIYAPSKSHEACALDSASPGCAVAPARPAPRGRWALSLGLSAAALSAAGVAARRRARRG